MNCCPSVISRSNRAVQDITLKQYGRTGFVLCSLPFCLLLVYFPISWTTRGGSTLYVIPSIDVEIFQRLIFINFACNFGSFSHYCYGSSFCLMDTICYPSGVLGYDCGPDKAMFFQQISALLWMNCSPIVCTLIPNDPCFFVDLGNSSWFQATCKCFTDLTLRRSINFIIGVKFLFKLGETIFITNNRACFVEFFHNKYLRLRLPYSVKSESSFYPSVLSTDLLMCGDIPPHPGPTTTSANSSANSINHDAIGQRPRKSNLFCIYFYER